MFEFVFVPDLEDQKGGHHVDNVVIYGWLDRQRTALFVEMGFVPKTDFFPAILKANIEYHAELFAESPVTITSTIKRVGNSSFVTLQTIEQDGKTCVTLESVAVNVNNHSRSSMPIPGDVAARMQGLMAA